MNDQYMNLNIRYDAPTEIWEKVATIYEQTNGWIEYNDGIPYWYSFDEEQKHIYASVEPSGLFFAGKMDDDEWDIWCASIKEIATKVLGYKIGEIEKGEVDF